MFGSRIRDLRCRKDGSVLFAEAPDVADHGAVRALAGRVTDAHGAMDVVMNVAGISAWGTVQSLEHRQWRSMVEVNLMGPIHTAGGVHHAGPRPAAALGPGRWRCRSRSP
jgi:NAD(P)-dependent dehydrogenase (short-subunit alcohol dehydrogenase family)